MIASTYFWSVTLLLGLGTFIIRFSIIGMSHKVKINSRTRELLSYIPAAILPAILAPMVFFHQGKVDLLLGKERLAVLILSTIVSYFTKSMFATISFGLVTLYIVNLL
jgi:branched-subunit amino acid transport protein